MCYKSNNRIDKKGMIEQPKFDNSMTAFVKFLCLNDSGGFEECHLNNTLFNYYIKIKLFQRYIFGLVLFSHSVIYRNETNTSFGMYGSDDNQQQEVEKKKANINQRCNVTAIIENETVNDLSTLQFLRHSWKLMKVFSNYFYMISIQNNVFNGPFGEYILYVINKLHITHTSFTINNIFHNNDSTCNIFDNCIISTIMGTISDDEYSNAMYSEHNDFYGNNSNLITLLPIINNAFQSSVLNEIFTTEVASPNSLHPHDNEYPFYTVDILNTNPNNSDSLILTQLIILCHSFSKIRDTYDIVFDMTGDYFIDNNINIFSGYSCNNVINGCNDEFIWNNYHLNDNNHYEDWDWCATQLYDGDNNGQFTSRNENGESMADSLSYFNIHTYSNSRNILFMHLIDNINFIIQDSNSSNSKYIVVNSDESLAGEWRTYVSSNAIKHEIILSNNCQL